jgi:hypothetical protein
MSETTDPKKSSLLVAGPIDPDKVRDLAKRLAESMSKKGVIDSDKEKQLERDLSEAVARLEPKDAKEIAALLMYHISKVDQRKLVPFLGTFKRRPRMMPDDRQIPFLGPGGRTPDDRERVGPGGRRPDDWERVMPGERTGRSPSPPPHARPGESPLDRPDDWEQVGPGEMRPDDRQIRLLEALSNSLAVILRLLPSQTLAELLKHPLCVREPRRIVLDQLGDRYGRRFEDQWDFVRFAEEQKLGLDFTSPVQRP